MCRGQINVDNFSNIAEAIGALPEFSKRKKRVDMHSNIASALNKKLQERDLVSYYLMEENIMLKYHHTQDKQVSRVVALRLFWQA